MRDPLQDSEFSRNASRFAADRPGIYGSEFGPMPTPDTMDAQAADTQTLKTGTTTVGLSATDGVVLATDQRASLGGQIVSNKNVQKVEQVQYNAAMTIAGSVGGAQALLQTLRAEINLYEARRGEYLGIEALSTLTSNLFRSFPVLVTPILGGADETGNYVYSLDPSGARLADDYTATGSGLPYAYGLLEDEYHEDLSVEEAVPVAAKAIKSGVERDTASGNGVWIAKVTTEDVDIQSYKRFDEII